MTEKNQPGAAYRTYPQALVKRRLPALMNAERFSLEQAAHNRDRYERLLRVVKRRGRSLGDILVREGLAHIWRGRRESWCGPRRAQITG